MKGQTTTTPAEKNASPTVVPPPVSPVTTETIPTATKSTDDPPKQLFRELRDNDGKPSLQIEESGLRGLGFQLRESLNAGTGPTREIGGIVAGVPPESTEATDKLLEFQPVAIRHMFGPEFRPWEVDQRAFDEVAAKISAGGKSQVIGCYRSQLSGQPEVRDEDRWLMQRVFGDRRGLLIVVQSPPRAFQSSMAHVYERTAGAEVRFLLRFPLVESVAPKPELAEIRKPPAPTQLAPIVQPDKPSTELATVPKAETLPALVVPPVEKSLPKWVIPTVATVVVLIAAEAALRLDRYIPWSGTRAVPIGLNFEKRDGDVELRWNVASPAARNAVRATLVIVDSGAASRFELNTSDLVAGKYDYKPVKGDLMCQIMFYHRDNTFVGETKEFNVSVGDEAAEAAAGPPTQPTPAAPKPAPPPKAAANIAPAKIALTPKRNAAVTPLPARTSGLPSPLIEVPPAPVQAAPQIQSPPTQAVVTPREVPAQVSSAPINPPPVVNRPSETPPATTFSTPLGTALATPPAVTSQSVVYLPPVPLRRTSPSLPPVVRSLLKEPTSVKIMVQVDSAGKVTGARPDGDLSGIGKLLAPPAIQAAKTWQFTPAKRDGVPVAGEIVVQFQFAK